MDIQHVAHRLEDPIHFTCEEAVRNIGNRRMAILIDYVMGHLPGELPKWAVTYVRGGIHRKLKAELKHRGFVYRDGRYLRFADMSIREAWAYVNHLEESVARDRARIKSIKSDLRRAELIAGSDSNTPIGELLGWDSERAA